MTTWYMRGGLVRAVLRSTTTAPASSRRGTTGVGARGAGGSSGGMADSIEATVRAPDAKDIAALPGFARCDKRRAYRPDERVRRGRPGSGTGTGVWRPPMGRRGSNPEESRERGIRGHRGGVAGEHDLPLLQHHRAVAAREHPAPV